MTISQLKNKSTHQFYIWLRNNKYPRWYIISLLEEAEVIKADSKLTLQQLCDNYKNNIIECLEDEWSNAN